MAVDEREREQAILDAAAGLLLRLGYDKLTMRDVAEAADLHRGLLYLRFKSKDQLVEAVLVRELGRYAETWRGHLEADPRGGDVAGVYRAMVHVLKTLPLAAAISARDPVVFGKYLRKPSSLFQRRAGAFGMREFLRLMQEAGTMRRDVDARAVGFILDALTPALRESFIADRARPADPDRPSSDEVLAALADLLDRALTPPGGADLAAGKALLLDGVDQVRAALGTASGGTPGPAPGPAPGPTSSRREGEPS
ncbi:TetR/AcrR family transcriptional regulator [Nonomuraea sp. PA05]|uniref:TetR/AcrR family transcriptional regulator n=1 Tax=Nonomuraea sp. PA05 TaxID=2604466 RepID=UPI0021CC600E|nr:TetR/AcrR family transcriptional regulator [Nonomuraea sp. PA05]